MAIVFRGVHFLCALKGCLGLFSQGEASIVFCPASGHCDGSENLSLRHRTHLPFTPQTGRLVRNVNLPGSVRSGRIVGNPLAIQMDEWSPISQVWHLERVPSRLRYGFRELWLDYSCRTAS